jgi:hypothetical protein
MLIISGCFIEVMAINTAAGVETSYEFPHNPKIILGREATTVTGHAIRSHIIMD